jgi:hypothetical protein
MRLAKFESQDESSRWVLHKPHSPRAFLTNGLIDRLILMFVVFGTHRKSLVLLEARNSTFLERGCFLSLLP